MYGLRTRRESDFADFTAAWSKESIDGRIDYRHPDQPPYTNGCLNGAYTFKTRVPITRKIFGPEVYEAGDLAINGSMTAHFFTAANVPAGLPVPVNANLVHLDVKNVGTFDYDVNGLFALTQIAQCN